MDSSNYPDRNPDYDERQRVITELTSFISEHEDKLDELLLKFNWTKEKTMDDCKPLVQCPVNNSHFVAESSLESHTKQCCLRRKGYTAEEQEEMQSLGWLYSKVKNVVPVKIDDQYQSNVLTQATGVYSQKPVAMTAEREVTTLTPHERALMHDHVVDIAKKIRSSQAISDDLTSDPQLKLKDEKKEPTTYLEMLAAQRDYKRRRQTYKGKSKGVTSNKKSQTEIMKEIIDIQMEELIEKTKARQSEDQSESEKDKMKSNTNRNNSSKQSSREGSQCSSRLSHESSPHRSTSPNHSRSPQRKRHRHRSRSPASRDRQDQSERKHKSYKHKD